MLRIFTEAQIEAMPDCELKRALERRLREQEKDSDVPAVFNSAS